MCIVPKSTLGKKYLMGITGLILVGFVLGHMVGNLKMFYGVNPETGVYKIDEYARFLREMGSPLFGHGQLLWTVRVVLLLSVLLHILAATQLTLASRSARPLGYKVKNHDATSYAARTMRWGGVILALYIVYHLLHFTLGVVHSDKIEHGWVYWNIYQGFKLWYISLSYAVAMLALALHLSHAVWSVFQTFGLDRESLRPKIKLVAALLGLVVFLGFMAVPVCVMSGCLPEPVPYSFLLK